MALSSGYLEELSVRYKKQIEDLQMSVRQANVALMEAADDRQQNRRDTAVLREKLDNISTIVEEVTSQLETISAWVKRNRCYSGPAKETHTIVLLFRPLAFTPSFLW